MRLLPILVLALSAVMQTPVEPQWLPQNSGVTARLRGVSAVSENVAWASGTGGTVVRTTDGGRTWESRSISGAEDLDLRDIDAIDENVAYALSIGTGDASRIYKTTDGGRTWTLQFTNRDPEAFFDAMAFWDAERGIAVSDSVDGRFVVLLTGDGGRTWTPAPAAGLPPALPGESYFAASGTNVATWGTDHAWLGTGAASEARVLRSSDRGLTWEVSTTPIPAGSSSGIFSIAFRDASHGIVVGGDYRREGEAIDNAAVTSDGGASWTLVTGLSGYRSAVAHVPAMPTPTLVAVGPSGTDYSLDDGRTWTPLSSVGLHALSFARGATAGWAVGEEGRIVVAAGWRPDLLPGNPATPGEQRKPRRRFVLYTW